MKKKQRMKEIYIEKINASEDNMKGNPKRFTT